MLLITVTFNKDNAETPTVAVQTLPTYIQSMYKTV